MTNLSKAIRSTLVDLGNKEAVRKFDQIQKNFKKKPKKNECHCYGNMICDVCAGPIGKDKK